MRELLQRMNLGQSQQLQQQENTDKEHRRSKYSVEEFLQQQKLVLQLIRALKKRLRRLLGRQRMNTSAASKMLEMNRLTLKTPRKRVNSCPNPISIAS
jgi:hypothetical protein